MNLTEKLVDVLSRLESSLERDRDLIAASLAETQNAVRLRGARALPAPGAGGRPLLWSGSGRLVGWSLTATGGPVTVTLTDSRDGAGDPIASIAIADGGDSTVWAGPGGVSFGEGLFATVTGAGTLGGAFWIGAVD